MNCRRGDPSPITLNGVPFSAIRCQDDPYQERGWGFLTLCEVALVDEGGDDVGVFQITVEQDA